MKNNESISYEEYPPEDIFYRCGWCGNVVDYDGAELSPEIRNDNIRLLQKFGNAISVEKVNGYCCKDKC